MSLLLDALKKSEAQRRRESPPTIDLTRTPPSDNSRRPGLRWLPIALAGVLLVAAAPWLWPQLSGWLEGPRGGVGEPRALDAGISAAGSGAGAETESDREMLTEPAVQQAAQPPVAGASSARRVVAVSAPPAEPAEPGDEGSGAPAGDNPDLAGTVQTPDAAEVDAGPGSTAPVAEDVGPPPNPEPDMRELRRTMQARQQQARAVGSNAAPEAKPEPSPASAREAEDPIENFIRPWELPQSERADFPELRLTVHFYAEREADRFVLINGERYREGQRVGPGTRLVEIRKRGAVVEFGSYRVLIE